MINLLPKQKCNCSPECNVLIPVIKYKGYSNKYAKNHMGKGKDHPCWKGGIRYDRNGYEQRYSPNHPFKDKNNLVRTHRLVIEEWLTKLNGILTYIHPSLDIHHKDNNILNNELSNLIVLSHDFHISITNKKYF